MQMTPPQVLFRHLCIAVYSRNVGKALGLDATGIHNPFAYGGTGFSWCCLGDFFKGEGEYLALYVYAVEQWAADFIQIA